MGTYSLAGKTVLVTGAARGIGLATARLMHERGAALVLTDLDVGDVEQAAESVGERALGVEADVTDRAALERAVAQAVERFGGLDVAVANAGIAPPPALTTRLVGEEVWQRVIDVNLLGVWHTARAVLPQVVQRRGQVVALSSIYAWVNGAGASSYAVSKAGVEAFARALRAELRPHGASATSVHFGFIDTKMVRDAFSDPIAERFMVRIPRPLRRLLTPEDAGRAIVRAVERRAARVIEPPAWRVAFALRGVAGPALDRLMERDPELVAMLREAEGRAG